MNTYQEIARDVLVLEAEAVRGVAAHINEQFDRAIERLFACTGRVVVTGMGKCGQIGRKISATFASTGTPSVFRHPADAIHGDLGLITEPDVVLALSNSGETEDHPPAADDSQDWRGADRVDRAGRLDAGAAQRCRAGCRGTLRYFDLL